MGVHQHLTSTAAELAINYMRQALGKSRIAYEWAKLTQQQRAMICYGAKLRPSTYSDRAIEEMTATELEQLRVAFVEMRKAARTITTACPKEWSRAAEFSERHQQTQQEQARTEQRGRFKLNQQVKQLDARLTKLKEKSPVSGN